MVDLLVPKKLKPQAEKAKFDQKDSHLVSGQTWTLILLELSLVSGFNLDGSDLKVFKSMFNVGFVDEVVDENDGKESEGPDTGVV
ncbi:hypothetical protein HanXRQr2_Chr01g0032941 [Helianthus annuus]|uniref:Uncharacterized protein n=1 Tax=Helianthus annuus TaxID=4232 RepID=A0A9K3P5A4_HELAN|nr:hypothetical protein HanXRQr2_Chr01g0032941 [Helianthus annuus]KAJ0957817.1 hypothetical protein HanPSC8_Chr01g0032071 [Helianthus annuus]